VRGVRRRKGRRLPLARIALRKILLQMSFELKLEFDYVFSTSTNVWLDVQQHQYSSLFIILELLSCAFLSLYKRCFVIAFYAVCVFTFLPVASASPDHSPFPNVTFKVFSDYIQNHFDSQISLSAILTILFSLTNNPDLLTLHARQQYPMAQGEIAQSTSGWIKALANALKEKLDDKLLSKEEKQTQPRDEQITSIIGSKLDGLSKVLGLHPFDKKGRFLGKLKPISDQDIKPALVICPVSVECETRSCGPRAILRYTRDRDISKAVLIKGTVIFDDVSVLTGHCSKCQTSYHADHERFRSQDAERKWMKLYLNSAKYLKIGQTIWVDRTFSNSILGAMYTFHGSATAIAEFWNRSYWSTQNTTSRKISRRQVWHAFVQESV